MTLLDPKNDYIFKRLFATAPHLLTALINSVRHEEEPVEVVEVLNPRIDPEELAGKFIVLQQAHWCFELRDRWQPATRLGAELELNIIELAKADRLHKAGAQGLNAWVMFFEHWKEDSTMSQLTYPPVQQALEVLKDLSADDETQRKAFVRERALRDEISQLASARMEGKQEGKQEGLQAGEKKGLQEAKTKMLQSGMSEEQVRAILGV